MRAPSFGFTALALPLLIVIAAACTPAPPVTPPGDAGSVDQTPPEGDSAMQAWLDEEHHTDWTCQPEIGPGVEPSPHGRRRICHNDALVNALSGEPLPVGSAVVKEIYDDNDERTGTAVLVKAEDGTTGESWYWYERTGVFTVADGRNALGCVGCHEGAANDGGREMVYVTVE